MESNALDTTLARIAGVQDVMGVRRLFGEPYEVGGATIIPVAAVRGGGGGGDATGDGDGSQGRGGSGGMGFGVNARPVGVYVVQEGKVAWQPAVDVMRIVLGGQLLAFAAILALRSILRRRR
jgi:uncharacterized spore protein YtfJ